MIVSLVALSAAAPQDYIEDEVKEPEVRILNQYFNQDGNGNYEYGYSQDNGQLVSSKLLTKQTCLDVKA